MKTVEFLGEKFIVEGSVGAPEGAIFLDTLPAEKLVLMRNLIVSHLDLGRRIKMFQNKAKGIKAVIDLLLKYDVAFDDMEEFNDDLPEEMQPAPVAKEAEVEPASTGDAEERETLLADDLMAHDKAFAAATAPVTTAKVRDGSKQAALIALLKRPEGASIKEIAEALNWLNHTARGAISRDVKKRLGLGVTKSRVEGRGNVYRISE